MKVMVMIKGSGAEEGRAVPTEEMFAAMTAYNERLAKAGIQLDGAGLKPSAAGAAVILEGGTTSVVDGPFVEAKEIIGTPRPPRSSNGRPGWRPPGTSGRC